MPPDDAGCRAGRIHQNAIEALRAQLRRWLAGVGCNQRRCLRTACAGSPVHVTRRSASESSATSVPGWAAVPVRGRPCRPVRCTGIQRGVHPPGVQQDSGQLGSLVLHASPPCAKPGSASHVCTGVEIDRRCGQRFPALAARSCWLSRARYSSREPCCMLTRRAMGGC